MQSFKLIEWRRIIKKKVGKKYSVSRSTPTCVYVETLLLKLLINSCLNIE